MVNLSFSRFVRLSILALISCAALGWTAPVGIDSELSSWLRQHEATEASPKSRTLSAESPPSLVREGQLAISQSLHIKQLTPEELFKALVIRDALLVQEHPSAAATLRSSDVGAAAGRGRGRGRGRGGLEAIELPQWLDYPILKSQTYSVTFDKNRPPVQLPTNKNDLYESVRSYAANRYFLKLHENHESSTINGGADEELAKQVAEQKKKSTWMDQIRPWTRSVTIHQVAKDAVTAKTVAQKWAASVQRNYPGSMEIKAVQDSLERTWLLWLKGMREASGYAYIPIEQIMSKIHRRR